MKKNPKYANDKLYPLVVALYLLATVLVDLVRDIAPLVYMPLKGFAQPLRNVLFIGCVLYVAYLFFRYGFNWTDTIVFAASVVLWGVSALLSPEITVFWKDALLIFYARVFAGFVLLRHFRGYEKCARILSWFIPLIILYGIVGFFHAGKSYMTLSYNMMPLALFFIFYGLRQKKMLLEISGFLMFFIASLLGSRGALLGSVLGVILYLVILLARGEKKESGKCALHMLIGFGVIVAFHLVLVNISLRMPVPGNVGEGASTGSSGGFLLNSRTTNMIVNGTLASDTNRLNIYKRVLDGLAREPFKPHGLLGDRLVVCIKPPVTYMNYPHNIVLELLYQFGIPLGIVAVAGIAWIFIRKIRDLKKVGSMQLVYLLAFVPVTAVQLMLSSSYLVSWLFGAGMGLLLAKNCSDEPDPVQPEETGDTLQPAEE